MLWLGIRGGQNLAACGGQLRHRHRRFRLWRLRRWLGMNHLILEPIGEIGRAAGLALRRLRLGLAFGAARRAFDADMEVVVVAVHRSYLGKPAAVALGFPA